jgi:hypothetical protein
MAIEVLKRARAFSRLRGNELTKEKQLDHVCSWVQNIARDKRFMARNLQMVDNNPLGNHPMQEIVGGHQLAPFLAGEGMRDWGDYLSWEQCKKNLAAYKQTRSNFAVIRMHRPTTRGNAVPHLDPRWIALKLDQSYTGGWLNGSYPCAIFDPHVGQGMYSDQGVMAFDLYELIKSYEGRYIVYTWLLTAPGID